MLSNNKETHFVILPILVSGILKLLKKGNYWKKKSTTFSYIETQFYNQHFLIKNNIMA